MGDFLSYGVPNVGFTDAMLEAMDADLKNNSDEIEQCLRTIVSLTEGIPGVSRDHETLEDALSQISEYQLLEKTSCYDAESADVTRFLKRVLKHMRDHPGQEENVLVSLLKFSSEEGFVLPLRKSRHDTGSLHGRNTSAASLNEIIDEQDMENAALWEDLRRQLDNAMVAQLAQLPLGNRSNSSHNDAGKEKRHGEDSHLHGMGDDNQTLANRRADLLEKLSAVMSPTELWHRYKALRAYQLNKFVNEALLSASELDTSARAAGNMNNLRKNSAVYAAERFSFVSQQFETTISENVISMLDTDFTLVTSGFFEGSHCTGTSAEPPTVTPAYAVQSLYLSKLGDAIDDVLETLYEEIFPRGGVGIGAGSNRRRAASLSLVPKGITKIRGKMMKATSVVDAAPGHSLSVGGSSRLGSVGASSTTGGGSGSVSSATTAFSDPPSPMYTSGGGGVFSEDEPIGRVLSDELVRDLTRLVGSIQRIHSHAERLLKLVAVDSAHLSQHRRARFRNVRGVLKSASASDISLLESSITSLPDSTDGRLMTQSISKDLDSKEKLDWPWEECLVRFIPEYCRSLESLMESLGLAVCNDLSSGAEDNARQTSATQPAAAAEDTVRLCMSVAGNKLGNPKVIFKCVHLFVCELDEFFVLAHLSSTSALEPAAQTFFEGCSAQLKALSFKLAEITTSSLQSHCVDRAVMCLSSAEYVKNYVYHCDTVLSNDKDSKPSFGVLYRQYCELTENLRQQTIEYKNKEFATIFLHDAESHNWEDSKEFYEGERPSHPIHMWAYQMSLIQDELWNSCSPKTAQAIFGSVLQFTLDMFVQRYTTCSPSYRRTPQVGLDILCILSHTEEFLYSAAQSPDHLLDLASAGSPQPYASIHSSCSKLLASLTLLSSPLDHLYKAYKRGFHKRFKKKSRRNVDRSPALSPPGHANQWMSLIQPHLYDGSRRSYDEMQTTNALYIHVKLLLSQPEPNWCLMIQALIMKSYTLPVLLLTQDECSSSASNKTPASTASKLPSASSSHTPVSSSSTSHLLHTPTPSSPHTLSSTPSAFPFHPQSPRSPPSCPSPLCMGPGMCCVADSVPGSSSLPASVYGPLFSVLAKIAECGHSHDALSSVVVPVIDRRDEWDAFHVPAMFAQDYQPPLWMSAVMETLKEFSTRIIQSVAIFIDLQSCNEQTADIARVWMEELPCGCPFLSEKQEDETPELSIQGECIKEFITRFSESLSSLPLAVCVFCKTVQSRVHSLPQVLVHDSVTVQMAAYAVFLSLGSAEGLEQCLGERPSERVGEVLELIRLSIPYLLIGVKVGVTPHATAQFMRSQRLWVIRKSKEMVDLFSNNLDLQTWWIGGGSTDTQEFMETLGWSLVHNVLSSSSGHKELMSVYNLIKNNSDWILENMAVVSPETDIPSPSKEEGISADQRSKFVADGSFLEEKSGGSNPLKVFQKMNDIHLKQKRVLESPSFRWSRLLAADLGLSDTNTRCLMLHRHEFTCSSGLTEDEQRKVDMLKFKCDLDPGS